ncbi:hypothetical protein SAMN02799630_01428 [Paenibacillus sp. UNCCL117]|uniref:hypothetical protein n=1 Tax=unclassified Paenibacillus TaxID=185978 RepID=UPI000884FBEF|nr:MULTISPECIES: hypothetical protein [unclassified Paenibacillus]SDC76728.1 hypothetical protein SAMN04488602_103407 [Paenibacillus sp. cl123]SFW25674.1 hypothetical protein SAMN02799630_01428 [Paenibacillus sp. UNCCL117]
MDHFANFDEAFEYLKSMQAAREEVAADSLHRPAGQKSEGDYDHEGERLLQQAESSYFWMSGSVVFAEESRHTDEG